MKKDVTIAGASYTGVPSILIPLTSGDGKATFCEVSDTTATASDVASGKTFYDASGAKITGTGSGGGGSKYGIGIDDMFGEVDSNGQLHSPGGGDVDLVISGFTSMVNYVFSYKFARSNALKSVVFTDLQEADATLCFDRAFNECINLTSVSFPKLVSANGQSVFSYCFQGDTKLKTASFPLLEETTLSNSFQYVFGGCTQLESVDFSSLRVIGNANAGTGTTNRQFYYAFLNCYKLTSITFPALEEIWCNGTSANTGTFSYNAKVKKFYFPKLHTISKTAKYGNTAGANKIFFSCTALTEIHFGADNQSAIESTTGYSTKWGAPRSCTIYFDL